MPELPEVEHTRRLIERAALGRSIAFVRCEDDPIVFDGVGRDDAEAAFLGRSIRAVRRWGKYLWLELDRPPHPILHLGMTGAVRFQGDEPLVLDASPAEPDRSWPPRFLKLLLRFDDGAELAMTNARRFGRVLLRDDPQNEAPLERLGFDPLLAMPTPKAFAERLGRRKRAVIKGLLLDQSFAAGVGNWIADEVLFQAGIDPRRRVGTLSEAETRTLHRVLTHVIETSVNADARKARFPKSWLFHHRWHKNPDARTSQGERIEHLTVAGRTTAWVPSRQR